MSFASETKRELCRARPPRACCRRAACYGLLLFGRDFREAAIRLTTESQHAARMGAQLIAACTGAIPTVRTLLRRAGFHACTLAVDSQEDRDRVLACFGHTGREVSLRLNRAVLEDDCCWAAFLRGVFLSCGTVTDPAKDYRLEFVVPRMHLSRDLASLLGELPVALQAGESRRQGAYVVYVKGASCVADLLTYMGAPQAAMALMQTRMHKELRNRVNRQTNFETANLDKTADAAARQIRALRRLQDGPGGFRSLPEGLQELAQLRCEEPELSLRELGERLHPPLSRSGVNHRLQRLLALAGEKGDRGGS